MHRSKKKRSIIIFSLIVVLLCMVVGYAAFQTRLEIKGTSKVTSNWNIQITNVTNGTPIGSAENTIAPSWTDLTAYMETDLYDKGDAMEYDVTIENKGTIDAKLNDILTNLEKENNEAVIINFLGYTKGEVLKAGESKIVHVKIEYNPAYSGEETSSEVKIDFEYTQNNNETENPDNKYLVTYDCTTNGGNNCSSNNEYFGAGNNVNLNKTASKKGFSFIGWNTDKDAEGVLNELTMPSADITLYAKWVDDIKPTTPKITNSSNGNWSRNDVTVTVTSTDDGSGIDHYEWYENNAWTTRALTTSNGVGTITFTADRNLNIQFRAIDNAGNISEVATTPVKIDTKAPTVSISTTSTTNSITVVASAEATSGIAKYEYSKDGGTTWVNGGTNKTYTFNGLTAGTTYNIQVRVTSGIGKQGTSTIVGKATSSINKPTFKETVNSTSKTVTITYPSGCGSSLTCSYQKDNGSTINVTSTTAKVDFTANGSLIAKVSDGTNSVSSSYQVTKIVSISVGSVKGGSSSLPKSKAINGESITFTATPSSDYTYKGATVVCNNNVKYNVASSSKSFSVSDTACTSAVLYPTWKKNDKYIMNGSSRDSTFSMNKYDTNANKPVWRDEGTFYAMVGLTSWGVDPKTSSRVSIRGQAVSNKTYNLEEYAKVQMIFGGSAWQIVGGRPVIFLGIIRNSTTWIHSAASPDYQASVAAWSGNTPSYYNNSITLQLDSRSKGNKYYIAFQFLSVNNTASLNVTQILLVGQTYSYTNRGI